MKLATYILMLIPLQSMCQTLVESSRVVVTSAKGEEVILFTSNDCDHCYFYLPSFLRISSQKGMPESSLVIWKDEEDSEVIGGILHFLVEWGLDQQEEKKVRNILRSTCDSLAVIVGPAMVYPSDNRNIIEGKDKLSNTLLACLKNTPAVPTTPGAKMALSFHFKKNEIDDFLFYMDHPEKTTTNLSIDYRYIVQSLSGQVRSVKMTVTLPFRRILAGINQER